MTDLFLEAKVMDYAGDRYELILLTLRWARQLKLKGDPAPMQELVEKALKDLVEKRVTPEEIMSAKAVVETPAPAPESLKAAAEVKEPSAKAGSNGAAKKTKGKKKSK